MRAGYLATSATSRLWTSGMLRFDEVSEDDVWPFRIPRLSSQSPIWPCRSPRQPIQERSRVAGRGAASLLCRALAPRSRLPPRPRPECPHPAHTAPEPSHSHKPSDMHISMPPPFGSVSSTAPSSGSTIATDASYMQSPSSMTTEATCFDS